MLPKPRPSLTGSRFFPLSKLSVGLSSGIAPLSRSAIFAPAHWRKLSVTRHSAGIRNRSNPPSRFKLARPFLSDRRKNIRRQHLHGKPKRGGSRNRNGRVRSCASPSCRGHRARDVRQEFLPWRPHSFFPFRKRISVRRGTAHFFHQGSAYSGTLCGQRRPAV